MLNREPVALAVTGDGTDFAVDVGGRRIADRDRLVAGRAADALPRSTGRRSSVQVDAVGSGWRLIHEGGQAEALVLTPRQAELYALMPVKAAPDTSKFLLSPMPGLLASVAVSEGQEVKAGEVLAVVEAMKMENVLRAMRDGTVKIAARQGRRQPARRPEDHRVRLRDDGAAGPPHHHGPGAGRGLSRLGDDDRPAPRPRRLGAQPHATARSRH